MYLPYNTDQCPQTFVFAFSCMQNDLCCVALTFDCLRLNISLMQHLHCSKLGTVARLFSKYTAGRTGLSVWVLLVWILLLLLWQYFLLVISIVNNHGFAIAEVTFKDLLSRRRPLGSIYRITYDFSTVVRCNYTFIRHRFWDVASYWWNIAIFTIAIVYLSFASLLQLGLFAVSTTHTNFVQESPADAGKRARRKTMKKFLYFEVITSSSQVGNPVFIVIKFLI